VAVNGGCVLLTGRVDSRQTKRLAEICIEDMPGVVEIINQLKFETGTRRS
jgi:osmotically-inducible protein OsmY